MEKPRARDDGHEPAVLGAEVRNAVDEYADEDGRSEGEQDPEQGDALERTDLGEIGRREEDAEEDDDDRRCLPARRGVRPRSARRRRP